MGYFGEPMLGEFKKKQDAKKTKEPKEAKTPKDSNLQTIRKTKVEKTSKNATTKGRLYL